MDCSQIVGYLQDYKGGRLPSFQAGWVVQHLAGCRGCQTLVEELKPPPVAAAVEAVREHGSRPVQRQVPVWLRVAGLVVAAAALGGAGLSFRHLALTPPREAPPMVLALQGWPAEAWPGGYRADPVEQGGVFLRLESVAAVGSELRATIRFEGRHLALPPEAGITVFGGDRRPLDSRVHLITGDPRGLTVEVRFARAPQPAPFFVRVGEVGQSYHRRWWVSLPAAPQAPTESGPTLSGSPAGTELLGYGPVGDMLEVTLRLPPGDLPSVIYLLDGAGGRHAAAVTSLQGGNLLHLRYPLPRELPRPLTLVGDLKERRQLGPWILEVTPPQ